MGCHKNRKQWIRYEREQRKSTHDTYRMYIAARNRARQYKARYQMYKRHAQHYLNQMRALQRQIQNQMRSMARQTRSGNWQARKALQRTNRFKRQHQSAVNRLRNGVRNCNNHMRNLINQERRALVRQRQLKAKYVHYVNRSKRFQHLMQRAHKQWRHAQRGLGHMRSVYNRAAHEERQWRIRYNHARG